MKKSENLLGTRDFYRAVAERGGYMKRAVREALDLFSTVLTEALSEGRVVRYAPLGTFYAVRRKKRGKDAAYITVRFKPARRMLAALNKTSESVEVE